jgi:hypothetical protein
MNKADWLPPPTGYPLGVGYPLGHREDADRDRCPWYVNLQEGCRSRRPREATATGCRGCFAGHSPTCPVAVSQRRESREQL